jgi:hypothetical protein
MSARERLTETLRNPGLVGLDEDEAAGLLDAYAHELAEQIRQRAAVQVGGEIEEIYGYAADLIGPEAEDYLGPVRPDGGELIPHNEDECGWEEGCRCLCRECQGRPGEEPTA